MIPGSLLGAGKSSLLRYGIYDGKEPRHKSQNPEIWDARERPPSYSTSPREKPGTFISTYWWIHLHRCVCVCVPSALIWRVWWQRSLNDANDSSRLSLSLRPVCALSVISWLKHVKITGPAGAARSAFSYKKRKNLEWWRAEAQDLRRRMKRELMTSRHWKFFSYRTNKIVTNMARLVIYPPSRNINK